MKALDIVKHKTNLTNILIDIYKNSSLAQVLGFKGGTAAMLFYRLPRFSIDLDFDLITRLEAGSPRLKLFMDQMTRLLSVKYEIQDQSQKYHTLFWLVSYGAGLTKIKIEVSTRDASYNHYHPLSFYGVTIKVMDIRDMVAHKLITVMDRPNLANRDLFDVHYFLSSPYAGEINYDIIKEHSDKDAREFYLQLLDFVNKIKPESVLAGKVWAKAKLIAELKGLIQRQIDLRELT